MDPIRKRAPSVKGLQVRVLEVFEVVSSFLGSSFRIHVSRASLPPLGTLLEARKGRYETRLFIKVQRDLSFSDGYRLVTGTNLTTSHFEYALS